MSSVYLILGTFLFLIIVLPSANTIITQTNCDCKMNQISTNGCKEMCDICEKTHDIKKLVKSALSVKMQSENSIIANLQDLKEVLAITHNFDGLPKFKVGIL